MKIFLASFLFTFSLCFSLQAEEEIRFDPSQDPNMVKTAPKKQSRIPAQFDQENQFSDTTEGQMCFGSSCEPVMDQNSGGLFRIDPSLIENTNPDSVSN